MLNLAQDSEVDFITALLNKYLFHWTHSKALWIGGYTLPWDARCSGIYIGFGISAIYHLVYNRRTSALPPAPIIFFNILMLIPLPLDVLTIVFGLREPSNDIRFLTGLLFGASVCVFLYPAFVVLAHKNIQALSAFPTLQKSVVHYLVVVSAIMMVKWDNSFSYSLLAALSIIGSLGLAAVSIICLWKIIANKREEKMTVCTVDLDHLVL